MINHLLILSEKINIDDLADKTLPVSIRALQGSDWSTAKAPIIAYRKELLVLQKYRCAYCKMPIFLDENGLRELDHIIPKDQSAVADPIKCLSEINLDRRHTNGYPSFTYEPLNLAVTCKQCNNFKGLFDSLLNRKTPPVTYPPTAISFNSLHPHYHNYSEHIHILKGWIYEGVSPEGKTIITTCKLDKAEVLARRDWAKSLGAQSKNLLDFLKLCNANKNNFPMHGMEDQLIHAFGVPADNVDELIAVWLSDEFDSIEGMTRAWQLAQKYLNKNETSQPTGELNND